jgi:hypothetical protein
MLPSPCSGCRSQEGCSGWRLRDALRSCRLSCRSSSRLPSVSESGHVKCSNCPALGPSRVPRSLNFVLLVFESILINFDFELKFQLISAVACAAGFYLPLISLVARGETSFLTRRACLQLEMPRSELEWHHVHTGSMAAIEGAGASGLRWHTSTRQSLLALSSVST